MLDLNAMTCFIFFTESTQNSFSVCVVVFFLFFVFSCFKAKDYIIIILLQEKNKTLDDIIENRSAMASLETGRSFRKLFSKEEIMIVPLGVVRRGPIKNCYVGRIVRV